MEPLFKCIAEIAGYEDCIDYDIYRDGRVWSRKSNRFLNCSVNKDGYRQFRLYGTTKRVEHCHRIMGKAFIPNPDNLPFVDHINGVRNDNRIDNLRWSGYDGNSRNHCMHNSNTTGEECIIKCKKIRQYHDTYYWRIQIRIDSKRIQKHFNIGNLPLDATQDDIDALYKANPITDEMKKCRDDMKKLYHGEFSSTHRQ
jgi:hypothetical protein